MTWRLGIGFRKLLCRSKTRINLLFTMSEIPQAKPVKTFACEVMFRGRLFEAPCSKALHRSSITIWWSQTGSNRRPHACKARALPAELWPRTRRRMLFTRSPSLALRRSSLRSRRACRAEAAEQRRLVGLGRLELPTSRLSSARSNQLSYKPLTLFLKKGSGPAHAQPAKLPEASHKRSPGACSSAKKEKRRRRNPANGAQRSGDRWPLMFQKRFDSCLLQVASF